MFCLLEFLNRKLYIYLSVASAELEFFPWKGQYRNNRAILYAINLPVLTFMLPDRNWYDFEWRSEFLSQTTNASKFENNPSFASTSHYFFVILLK